MRFGDAYPVLGSTDLDPHRLQLFHYAQVLSPVEGPLRIAGTDFRTGSGCWTWPNAASLKPAPRSESAIRTGWAA